MTVQSRKIHPGPRNLITDVPGILVGHAVDDEIRTGATVIYPEKRCVAAADVRGGAPGSQQLHLIAPENISREIDAIVLSGGSLYGLAAAQGVTAELGAKGRGAPLHGALVPTVPSAIIFDLLNHAHLNWYRQPPYERLGRDALAALSTTFALGNVGAGYAGSACSFKGGLGSASVVTEDGVILGALVIVNSFGEVVVPGTRNFWAWPFEQDGEFGGLGAPPLAALSDAEMPLPLRLREPGMSTTLAVVATNVRLDRPEAKRLAIMAHDGLSRAIRPVHTPYDGDIVFALSVGDHPLADPLQQARLGHLAADCVARAIARAVFNAKGMAGLPGYADAIG